MSPRARSVMQRKAEEHGFTLADLIGTGRRHPLAVARFDAMAEVYALHKAPGQRIFSTPQVGQLFGGRDHTTVIAALRRAEAIFGKRHPIYPNAEPYDGEETRL